ncbi:MAG: cobalt-precorrin-5B (C(1))-methyltransferase, partial [Desulfobacterium sp.]|nr:cobalt-precorrin-5B (C(1))-methyltransferase [Desulfobacterium sp.]
MKIISKNKNLRFGYTTGACAAAAAKAATMLLMKNGDSTHFPQDVEIPFPDGSRVRFKIHNTYIAHDTATASVIKDAGDDPDVTNGAEIVAEVRIQNAEGENGCCPYFCIKGGKGVGTVTKPGLPAPVGEPAINPVPRQMIKEAVREVTDDPLEITISVPNGEELAKKTLN